METISCPSLISLEIEGSEALDTRTIPDLDKAVHGCLVVLVRFFRRLHTSMLSVNGIWKLPTMHAQTRLFG